MYYLEAIRLEMKKCIFQDEFIFAQNCNPNVDSRKNYLH